MKKTILIGIIFCGVIAALFLFKYKKEQAQLEWQSQQMRKGMMQLKANEQPRRTAPRGK